MENAINKLKKEGQMMSNDLNNESLLQALEALNSDDNATAYDKLIESMFNGSKVILPVELVELETSGKEDAITRSIDFPLLKDDEISAMIAFTSMDEVRGDVKDHCVLAEVIFADAVRKAYSKNNVFTTFALNPGDDGAFIHLDGFMQDIADFEAGKKNTTEAHNEALKQLKSVKQYNFNLPKADATAMMEYYIGEYNKAKGSSIDEAWRYMMGAFCIYALRDGIVYEPITMIEDPEPDKRDFDLQFIDIPDNKVALPVFTSKAEAKRGPESYLNQISFYSVCKIMAGNDGEITTIAVNWFGSSYLLRKEESAAIVNFVNGIKDEDYYFLSKGDVTASGIMTPWGFAVFAGAGFVTEPMKACQMNIIHRREKMVSEGMIEGENFVRDVVYNTPSMAANCITGGSGSPTLWKNKFGKPIQ